MMGLNLKLEKLLIHFDKVTQEELNEVYLEKKTTNKSIDELLIKKGYITNSDIIEVLEFQLGMPYVDLNEFIIEPDIVAEIPEVIARRYDLIAIARQNESILVAMSDPLNIFAIDDIENCTEYNIKPVISNRESIQQNINKYYQGKGKCTENTLKEFTASYEPSNFNNAEDEELLEVTTAPIVKLINSIFEQAIDMNASDIHIEPFAEEIRLRFRIDGDLHEIMRLSKNSFSAIVTRIKIIGKIDIAEKRIPQDGRVEIEINNKEIDMRISTIPTIHGEKIVIRLLDRSNFMFSKDELGFTGESLKAFNKILDQPFGMILLTGPTGSGKSTTLYATLKELNKTEKNIITIEDPVEYKIEGINQTQINSKAGFTFEKGLRSILRQDPDIIMVGEIRDSETAHIAIRSSITGHLVMSTLHTNDSPSSIARLIDMGVKPYLVSSAIIGIISQRLIKNLCPNCKIPYEANHSEKLLLKLNTNDSINLYKAKGCNKCTNGYRGRRAVHEVMVVNEEIRLLINKGASIEELRNSANKCGMVNLLDSSIELAIEGITTVEEVLKTGYTLG